MPQRTLVVLRHAEAEEINGRPDIERQLTEDGRRDAAATGERLRASGLAPDVVVCSPALRTRQTEELVRAAAGYSARPSYDAAIYRGELDDLLDVVAALPEEAATALLVAHNPGCTQLVEALSRIRVRMRPSAVVALSWAGAWADAGSVPAELTEL